MGRIVAPVCVAVAYSGGRDSTALLHATARVAAAQGAQVLALHVHHGLSPSADAWLAHVQAQCAQWAADGLPVRLRHTRLNSLPTQGDSVEAWARRARYEALRHMAQAEGVALVLLAHHQRDQAETLLLQALRGAGVAGLAGMPRSVQREGITWMRPWLARPRADIEHYLHVHGLNFVDDDSNSNTRFARNRLRLQLWPVLMAAFPDAEVALAVSATWAAQASQTVADVAAQDVANAASARGLQRSRWLALSEARRAAVLKHWLHAKMGRMAPSSLVTRLQAEWPQACAAQWSAGAGLLRHHRGWLLFEAQGAVAQHRVNEQERPARVCITRAGRYALPAWGGVLHVQRVKDAGVPLAWLAHGELRSRQGGEQFQMGLGRPPRSLKKQYQAADVPAWLRDGPLLYSGGQLVFVPGLGLDARVIALPGQPQVSLAWERSS